MDGQNIQTSDSKEIPCDTDIDGFKLLGRGIGIDEKEFYIINLILPYLYNLFYMEDLKK